jgi:hypothetical protein
MEKKPGNRSKRLYARVTDGEYKQIHRQFSNTTCRKFSEYIRNKLLEKHITTYYRNKSLDDFMAEAIRLRADLNAIGNNFNQAVRKLNSMKPEDDPNRWAAMYERDKTQVMEQVAGVNKGIQKLAEQWLQNSIQTPPSGAL